MYQGNNERGIEDAYSAGLRSGYGTVDSTPPPSTKGGGRSPRDNSGELEVEYGTPSKVSGRSSTRNADICKFLTGCVTFVLLPFLVYAVIRVSDIEHAWLFRSGFSSKSVWPTTASSKPITVMLMGDQLLSYPLENYDLEAKVKEMLPGMPLKITTHAEEHQTLTDMRWKMDKWLLADKPDAVMMLAMADITDAKWDLTSRLDAQFEYDDYAGTLHSMLGRLALNSHHLAMMGPGVIGDGSWWLAPHLIGKQPLAALYKAANQKYASKYDDSEYVDLQASLKNAVPWWYPFSWGFVTVDGERVNRRGSYILAAQIASQLRKWYWPKTAGENDDFADFEDLLVKDLQNEDALEDAKINEQILYQEMMQPLGIDVKAVDGKLKTVDKPLGEWDDDSIFGNETWDGGLWGGFGGGFEDDFGDDDMFFDEDDSESGAEKAVKKSTGGKKSKGSKKSTGGKKSSSSSSTSVGADGKKKTTTTTTTTVTTDTGTGTDIDEGTKKKALRG